MFGYYLKTLVRSLWKQRLFPAVNIIGLAFAFAACLLIMMWVTQQFSYDRFHKDSENIYRIAQRQEYASSSSDIALTMGPMAETVKGHFPAVAKASRFQKVDKMMVEVEGKKFVEKFAVADQDFFDIFSFPFIAGDPNTCFQHAESIVLTKKTAEKLFGSPEIAIGSELVMDEKAPFKVTGVIENIPENSHINFDMMIPVVNLKMIGVDLDNWGNNSFYTYLKLEENVDVDSLEQQIFRHVKGLMEKDAVMSRIYLQPLERIYLFSDFDYDFSDLGNFDALMIFMAIGFLVLIIAAINFINLSTAQFSRRSMEVGVKKVAGADKKNLLFQYLGESIFLALLAGLLAIGIVELLLPLFNSYLAEHFKMSLMLKWPIPAIYFAIVVITGILAGFYPAFVLSSFKPVDVLKSRRKGVSRSSLRKILVVVQFFFSAALISCSIILINQLAFVNSAERGYDINKLLQVSLHGEAKGKAELMRMEMKNIAGVEQLTVVKEKPTDTRSAVGGFRWIEAEQKEDKVVYRMQAGYDVVKTMGYELLAGEDFSEAAGHKPGKHFLINETMAASYPGNNALGAKLIFHGDTGEVVGIVGDFYHQSLREPLGPLVISIIEDDYDYLIIRGDVFSENYNNIRRKVKASWEELFPELPFDGVPVMSENMMLYEQDLRLMIIFVHFTLLAILIALIGLFGLVTYTTNYRFREIAIRKVLGAHPSSLMIMLMKEYLMLIVIANILAAPIAWFAMLRWMESFYYSTEIGILPFAASLVLTMFFGLLAVFFRTRKAVKKTPVDAIKYE